MTVWTQERADQLLEEFGFESWRPGQREAVAATLEERDSLIVMPTGGGKSLCYQLPGLASPDLTIVVSPLIALMRDQWERLVAKGHPVAMVSSDMRKREIREALVQVGGDTRIVFCAPERFWSEDFVEAISSRKVDFVAVDEAHCVSEWGHDFRPHYLRLPRVARELGWPTIMACTATATEQVATEIARRFQMQDPLQVRTGFDRRNLSFDVAWIKGRQVKARRQEILEAGLRDPANRPAIVYCGTRRDTERVAMKLSEAGIEALAYHAGLKARDRTRVQEAFMSGENDLIVATNAFGMGIDKADVRSVWHMAIPTSVEAYYQEAGRAGRDGKPARAVLLALESDLTRLRSFNEDRAANPRLAVAYKRGWHAYDTIKYFVYSKSCRRRALLDHFSDEAAGEPLHRCCDVCDPQSWPLDVPTNLSPTGGRRRRSSSLGRIPKPPPTEEDRLFEALKAWRDLVAAGRPLYKVATNSTLRAIAAAKPADAEELQGVRGVGKSFAVQHAEPVLTVIAQGPHTSS